MSEYKFKPLSEVETVTEPADGTTVMGFEGGKPIQMPMGAVKGTSGVFVVDPSSDDYKPTDVTYGDAVKVAIIGGQPVWYRSPQNTEYIVYCVNSCLAATAGKLYSTCILTTPS